MSVELRKSAKSKLIILVKIILRKNMLYPNKEFVIILSTTSIFKILSKI